MKILIDFAEEPVRTAEHVRGEKQLQEWNIQILYIC